MPGVRSFTDLICWQRARQWSKDVFQLTQKQPFVKDERLVRQINDSTESVMANLVARFGQDYEI